VGGRCTPTADASRTPVGRHKHDRLPLSLQFCCCWFELLEISDALRAEELRFADEHEAAADFAGMPASSLQHVLVTEYGAGAGIGWHRDKAVFDEVVGVSLLAPCDFRFRRRRGTKWDRATVVAEPRSAYLLSGPARTEWEHGIPPVDQLRYSVTFRNFRETE